MALPSMVAATVCPPPSSPLSEVAAIASEPVVELTVKLTVVVCDGLPLASVPVTVSM